MHSIPSAARRAGRRTSITAPVAVVVALLLAWELVARLSLLPEAGFPTMTDTLAEAGRQLGTDALWASVGQTLQAWALGMLIALALAVPAGIALGSSHLLYRSVRPIVEFLRPIPSVALIPLAILIAGTGTTSTVGLAVFGAFWPLLLQCYYGMQDLDPVAQDTARSFGLRRFERFHRVSLPSAVPYIATGVRIASAVVLIVIVSAEIVIGAPGLGREIYSAQSAGAYEKTYAITLLIGILAWILSIGVSMIERRVLHWHPSQRPVAA